MKKAGLLILSALLAASTGVAAPASEETAEKTSFTGEGMNMALPQELEDTAGLLVPYPIGAIDAEHQTYAMTFLYEALPKEEALVKLYSDDLSEEEAQEVYDAQCIITMVLATEAGFDRAREVCEEAFGIPLNYEEAEEIGSAGAYTFYAVLSADTEFFSSISEEFAEEYKNLEQLLLEAERNADFYEPIDPVKSMIGRKLVFTTEDLDGNTVTSEELFSANKITMINCWGVWCPNCVTEMAELAEIHTRMQEKGCGIVGVQWEQTPDDATYREGIQLMEESGTNYPNVLMPDEVLAWLSAFPTSIFVDSEGTVLDTPIVGAQVGKYESSLEELLGRDEEMSEAVTEDSADSADSAAVYRVSVTDADGPVEGVTIQFCDDTTCTYEATDADGTVAFDMPAGKEYEVHVLSVPDGYKAIEEVYHTSDAPDEMHIELEKMD